MAVLGGFDDDAWFGLQNSQQVSLHHFNNNGFANQNIINTNNNQPVSINLESQLELQRRELEFILHLQNEKLRIALHDQRKQQLSVLMKSLEARATSVIKQKEEDLARATRIGQELQELLSKTETESQAWQRIARAKEATIMELNNALQQAFLVQNDNNFNAQNDINGAEDAVSSCFGSSEEIIAANDKNDNDVRKKWVCKMCKSRSSCVVFVPCKHLCSCKSCEAFVGSCPVCGSAKEASFEVFLV